MSRKIMVAMLMCLLFIGITPMLGFAFSSSVFTLPGEHFTPDDDYLLEIIAPPILGDDSPAQDNIPENASEKIENEENVRVVIPPVWVQAITVESAEAFPDTEADPDLAAGSFEVWAFYPNDIGEDSLMLGWQIMEYEEEVSWYEVFMNQNDGDFYSIVSESLSDGFSTVLRGNMVYDLPIDERYSYYVTVTDISNNTVTSEIITFSTVLAYTNPTATTLGSSNFTNNSAKIMGIVDTNGGANISEVGFRYTSTYAVDSNGDLTGGTKVSLSPPSYPFNFDATVSLTPANPKYWYQAYVETTDTSGVKRYGKGAIKTLVYVTSIDMNPTSYSIQEGSAFTITATANPKNQSNPDNNATNPILTWSSANDSIAVVSSGLVK